MEYGYEVLCALDLNFQRCDRQLEVTFVHCCLQLYVTCSNINAKQTGTFVSHRAVGRFQNLLGQIKRKEIRPHLHERGTIIHAVYHVREQRFIST